MIKYCIAHWSEKICISYVYFRLDWMSLSWSPLELWCDSIPMMGEESRSARVNSERQELAWDAIDAYFMRWGLVDSGWDRSWGSLRTLSDRRLGQRASWAFYMDGADRRAIRPRYQGRRGPTLPLVSSSVLQPEGNKSTIPWRTEALVLFSAHNPNQLGTAD